MNLPNNHIHKNNDPSKRSAAFKISIGIWLKKRQQLIVQVNQLCQLRPFATQEDPYHLEMLLLSFCQNLLGYISLGQCKLLDTMMVEIEKSAHKKTLPENSAMALKNTALAALIFSEQCAQEIRSEQLEETMSRFIEKLAYRFDLEDDVIKLYSLVATNTQCFTRPDSMPLGTLRN